MRLDDGRVVPNFIAQALANEPLTVYGDGQQTRSFQYVADLINGLQLLLMSDYHEPVNIGNPHEMSILEFAEAVQEVSGSASGIVIKPQDRIAGDPQVRRPDITRAQQVLGWTPKVHIADGLKLTIDYFRKHINGQ
jgi:dTDP-glucose 4,6-dehydratase